MLSDTELLHFILNKESLISLKGIAGLWQRYTLYGVPSSARVSIQHVTEKVVHFTATRCHSL